MLIITTSQKQNQQAHLHAWPCNTATLKSHIRHMCHEESMSSNNPLSTTQSPSLAITARHHLQKMKLLANHVLAARAPFCL